MVGKTFDDKLLVDDHQLWNYSAALSDFELHCYSFKFDAIMQVLHFHFSPNI
jgi:hypothetical protein